MPKNEILRAIDGYDEVIENMQSLAKSGTNFLNQKGQVGTRVAQLHPKRLHLVVSKVIKETATTKTLRLVAKSGGLPPFQAGQYINVFVEIDGVQTARPYAISSDPGHLDHYDVTVKRVPDGYVSNYLLDLVVVDMEIITTGPMGSFYHNPLFHGNNLVFIAGGSGVAPARPMIKNIINRQLPYKFHLIYGSRNQSDIIFRNELQALAKKHAFLTVTDVISEPSKGYIGRTGYITADLIKEIAGPVDDKMFYLCGPTIMYEFCRAELAKAGVLTKRIRIEANGPPKHPEDQEGWPNNLSPQDSVTITVQGKGSFAAQVGEPLLNSLERNGYKIENACRSGECSLCRVKILSGRVFNPKEAKLRSSDRTFNWCHSCTAFPQEDIEILF